MKLTEVTMALEKQILVDKIEVLGNGAVQVRTATRIVEDGNIVSASLHRHVISPGDDYSAEDSKVRAICSIVHTAQVISDFVAARDAQRLAALGQNETNTNV